MTQLFIAGVEVVLPKDFSTAVKRENSFFTKNGEYTYDVTVNLDNPINKALWPQWRLNNSKEEKSKRTAVLIADNRVYCNGTEVITGWTNNTVSIQIVSGNSELNYFIGQDLEIAYLTEMGEVDEATAVSATMKTVNGKTEAVVYPDIDYCLPPMYNETKGILINSWTLKVAAPVLTTESNIRVQPYVLAVIRRLINALGYTITTNQLENSDFRYMIFANFVKTKKYNEMFPGWTAKALLEEIENLLNVVFVINQESRECQIYIKTSYYVNTQQFSIKNVIDEYEVEVDEDGVDERSISNIRYTLPSSDYYSMAKLNKKVKAGVKTINCDSLSAVRTAIASSTSTDRNIYKDTSTGRLYIKYGDFVKYNTMEVNQLADLIHDDTTDDAIEIKLAPAPLVYVSIPADITTDRSSITGVSVYIPSVADTTDDSDDGSTTTDDTTTETLTEYITSTKEDSTTSECQLYIAFFNGFHKISTLTYDLDIPAIYTDSYHAQTCGTFVGMDGNTFVGSLRLEDIDNELYDGAYVIDTKHGVTIESFDPNKYDVRNIFIIGNKRYVCSTIEETIVAKGRQKKWKGTFYPITLSDTAANSRWVLNDGNWDDGGVWIDDGKWID